MLRPTLLLALASCAILSVAGYTYETKWWTAQLDNFNFANTGATFQLKYLINDTFYQPGGPIFFYTGNEGPIELFADNTGFMWDQAPVFNAMLVFAEHRYYGASLPLGPVNSFTNAGYAHLSAEQALADYALFLTSLKGNDTRIADAQVIAFGGSYGGMLSSWFRLKYPHIVVGAIAGSAPIWWFNTPSSAFDPKTYNRIASQDFKDVSEQCFTNIGNSWAAMTAYATAAGLPALSTAMGLCPGSLQTTADISNILWPWLSNIYSTLPMGDYPYPASFLGLLPGWPVNVTCTFFESTTPSSLDLVLASRMAADLYYNASHWPVAGMGAQGSCYNITAPIGISTLGAGNQWPYQTCTEIVMPIGQYGLPDDLFYPAPWDLAADMASCAAQFGTVPRPNWIAQQFGATPQDWSDATNIVFSNGNLDPWSGGGVSQSISATVVAIPVVGGAHHFDLRASDPADTPGVIWAREQEVQWIRTFLANPSPTTAVTECDNQSLLKVSVVLVSVFCTFVATILLLLLLRYCMAPKPAPESSDNFAQEAAPVNAPYKPMFDTVDADPKIRLTVR